MAGMNARLAALERRYSTLEAQVRTQNAQVVEAFRKAISVLEASSAFNSMADESGMLTAVDNSPSSELALKAAASGVASKATDLVCDTTSIRFDGCHPALKRRRTMADPRSMSHEQADPAPAISRPRAVSIASNESGELDDEANRRPDNERSHDKVAGASRRDKQSDSYHGARGADHREHERSPDGTFVDSAAKPCDDKASHRDQSHDHYDPRSKSRHHSRERRRSGHARSPSQRRSPRRQSHGHSKGWGWNRSSSPSKSPTRNRHQGRHKYHERQNGPSSAQKLILTGSNATSVPPGGPRRGRYNAARSPSPSARPSPHKNSKGPAQRSKPAVMMWGADTGKKNVSGRINKNAANNWGDPEPQKVSENQYSGWDIGSPEREVLDSGNNNGWDTRSPPREASNAFSNGWDVAGPARVATDPCTRGSADAGSTRVASDPCSRGWEVINPVINESGPTMPRSVNQLTSKVDHISSIDKVAAWRGVGVAPARASLHGPEDAVKAALSDCGSDDLGEKALASNFDASDRLFEDNISSSDEDDDDPRMLLKSKKRRAEIIVTMLNDSGGYSLTGERMAPLWKIFAWIPLDTLPEVYRKVHGVALWAPETKKQIRASIKDLPDLSERSSMDGVGRQTLIFRDKSHLKQPRAFQRLFIISPACEPVLFFYLVTTILQPLDVKQAKTIADLWMDEFRKGPTHVITTMQARGGATTKWESDEVVWKAAIEWLGQLAKIVMQHGKDYLTGKTNNWEYSGPLSRRDSHTAAYDPEKELVAGLQKDELTELLKATLVLLSKIIPESKLHVLRSEFS
ncbi:hypothetical protein LPJ60_004333 [Coemansia sp. RSA 2675]|nr:hypothetical protein LPJ60_004333 [Coemansia sp. RSA 2675]